MRGTPIAEVEFHVFHRLALPAWTWNRKLSRRVI